MAISVSTGSEHTAVANPSLWSRSDQFSQHRRGRRKTTRKPPSIVSSSYSTLRSLKSQTVIAQVLFDPKVRTYLRFKALVARWRSERGASSSITSLAMSDAYQEIIGMGPDAIPLIIAQMRADLPEPDHWFWALQVLTGVDPVPAEDRGDLVKMSKAWIDWAENEGYAW